MHLRPQKLNWSSSWLRRGPHRAAWSFPLVVDDEENSPGFRAPAVKT